MTCLQLRRRGEPHVLLLARHPAGSIEGIGTHMPISLVSLYSENCDLLEPKLRLNYHG